MNLPVGIYYFSFPHWIPIILGFLMAFAITWIIIPSIVRVSIVKSLYAKTNGRTSHARSTPTMGGIAVFIGVVLSTVIVTGTEYIFEMRYIIAGLIIIFFIGIKDDILVIDPFKKMVGQIIAALLIAVFADIRISDLYGLFQIEHLSYVASILLTVFVFIVVINGFNLIDGIDGLASGTGILTSIVFGIWFSMTGNIAWSIFSFSLAGSLSAFFYFNVFGKKNKIFLGDTGSLITGFVIGVLACRFLQLENVTTGVIDIPSAPAVVCGILIVPLFDLVRVFIIRISQGKSPFKADHQHIHHRLLQLEYTHLQASLILISVNLFFIVLSYFLRRIGTILLIVLLAGLAITMSYNLVRLAEKRAQKLHEVELLLASYLKKLYSKKELKVLN